MSYQREREEFLTLEVKARTGDSRFNALNLSIEERARRRELQQALWQWLDAGGSQPDWSTAPYAYKRFILRRRGGAR